MEKISFLKFTEFFPKLRTSEKVDRYSRIFSKVSRTIQSSYVQDFVRIFILVFFLHIDEGVLAIFLNRSVKYTNQGSGILQ